MKVEKQLYLFGADGKEHDLLRVTYDNGHSGLYLRVKPDSSYGDIVEMKARLTTGNDYREDWTLEDIQNYLFRTVGNDNCVELLEEGQIFEGRQGCLMRRAAYGESVEFYEQCRTRSVYALARLAGMVLPDNLPSEHLLSGHVIGPRKIKWRDQKVFSEVCARLADFIEILRIQREDLRPELINIATLHHINYENDWSIMQLRFNILDALQY